MIPAAGALLYVLALAPPLQAADVAADEAAVRARVQEYYDAQTKKDADLAAGFWSAAANPRLSREAFVAMFGAGDATYTVEIQRVAIRSLEARVRLTLTIARTVLRNDVPTILRQSQENSELWRKEGGTWRLMREGPAAEDFADDLLAAPAADRARLMSENPAELTGGLRYVLAQRASLLIPSGQYDKAREIFELALAVARATHDRRSESETLQNIANAYYFVREFDSATTYYQQRLGLSREMQDEEGIAASMLGLATVAYSRGDYIAALASYREALAIYERRDEGPSIGRALVSVGNVQYLQAEYDAAAASYRRALGLLAGLDRQGAALARSGLGRVFAAQGDLAAALDMYGQVLADARAGVGVDPRLKRAAAAPLESIGEIYYRLGNADQARANFEEARKLSEGDPAAVGRISASLGLTELVAGRFDAALAAYTDSRARFEQAKDPDGVARAWVGVGFSLAAREKYIDALAAYRTAIRMFDERKREEDSARAWLGLSLAQSGLADHEQALASARRVASTADAIKSDDLAWRAAVRAGEALRKLSRFDESRAEFTRAISGIDRLAADAPVNPDARAQLDDSASAWSGLAMVLAASGDPRGALDAVEARRAHMRRVQLAGFQRDITRGMSADEQAEEQGIVRELISTRAQIRAERGLPHPDAGRIDRLQQQLAGLVTRRGDQQARLYARLPDLQQWRALRSATSADMVNAAVEPGSLFVEYLLGDDELLIVTVAHGETAPDIAAALVPAKRRELAGQIAEALQPKVLADASEWRRRAAPLAATLLAPIDARLAGRARSVIVPDDLLWKVPFEALPSGEEPLAARQGVTYATSLATLAAQQRLAAGRSPLDHRSAAFFAAPSIPAPVRAQLTLAQPGWKEPDEEASLRSATDLAAAYGDGAAVRSKADASETAARAASETADVLHFGGPFQVSGTTPLFSLMVLNTTGEQADGDGRWEVREWFAGVSRARVLVAADGSSFGAPGIGGAMDTIAWASAALGVPSLVLGRWPADGFSNGTLLAGFHRTLAHGASPAEAWAEAVAGARKKDGDAPAAWAGARLIGARR